MKTPEILLAEAALTWFISNAIDYKIVDGETVKILNCFDDWENGESTSASPIYRQIVDNALKVLAQHAPKSPIYIRAKKAWETLPAYLTSKIMPPMGAKTKAKYE